MNEGKTCNAMATRAGAVFHQSTGVLMQHLCQTEDEAATRAGLQGTDSTTSYIKDSVWNSIIDLPGGHTAKNLLKHLTQWSYCKYEGDVLMIHSTETASMLAAEKLDLLND